MSSPPLLVLDQVVFAPGGKALSLELFPGDGYAVIGPALSARSSLVRVLTGESKPSSGSIHSQHDLALPRNKEYGRRHTPQSLAKSLLKRGSSSRLTTVLSGLGLWDVRQDPVHHLPPELVAACDLLPVFLSELPVVIIDGQLDSMDSWTRETTLDLVRQLRQQGSAVIVSTNLLTVASDLGSIIIVSGPSPIYAGPVHELLRATKPTEIVVDTDDKSSVQTMVDPFCISVSSTNTGLSIQADKGQEVAAKLLTQGYGAVRSIIVKEPTLADVLRTIV